MAIMATSVAKRILVADGDPEVLALAQALLGRQGYEVILAHDGRDALRKALAENPDAILLDTALPGMGRTDIYIMLKSNQATRHIPIAFLTGQQEPKDQKGAPPPGVLMLLPKPFKPQQLICSVGILVSARRKKVAG